MMKKTQPKSNRYVVSTKETIQANTNLILQHSQKLQSQAQTKFKNCPTPKTKNSTRPVTTTAASGAAADGEKSLYSIMIRNRNSIRPTPTSKQTEKTKLKRDPVNQSMVFTFKRSNSIIPQQKQELKNDKSKKNVINQGMKRSSSIKPVLNPRPVLTARHMEIYNTQSTTTTPRQQIVTQTVTPRSIVTQQVKNQMDYFYQIAHTVHSSTQSNTPRISSSPSKGISNHKKGSLSQHFINLPKSHPLFKQRPDEEESQKIEKGPFQIEEKQNKSFIIPNSRRSRKLRQLKSLNITTTEDAPPKPLDGSVSPIKYEQVKTLEIDEEASPIKLSILNCQFETIDESPADNYEEFLNQQIETKV